jgi:hypothetical protein
VAYGDSKYDDLIKKNILNRRENVPRITRYYNENGDELSGDNSRVNCTSKGCTMQWVTMNFTKIKQLYKYTKSN